MAASTERKNRWLFRQSAVQGLFPNPTQRYLPCCSWRFNRRFQLDSLTERLAYACAGTAPHPYRVIVAG